jgi:hypothetical protein
VREQEAHRTWLRLGAAAAVAAALSAPMIAPYLSLRAEGAERDLGSVVAHSADLLSLVTAPELTRLWGAVLDAFPRGEARSFPGVATPALAMIGLVTAVRACMRDTLEGERAGRPAPLRQAARVVAVALGAVGAAAAVAAFAGGWSTTIGELRLRVVSANRPWLLLTVALAAALAGWPRLSRTVRAALARPEVVSVCLSVLAVWLSLGPLVTFRGWPVRLPAPYGWLYEHVPGFASVRAPARFAMIAACFGALAAAWGVERLRQTRSGRRIAALLCAVFVIETAAVPLPLSRQWEIEGIAALPPWSGGPSPIVAALRELPAGAVLAVLPFGEMFHEARATFDSAYHWRRLLNGYSSWTPAEYSELAFAARDPLRYAPKVLDTLRAAGATHVVVYEAAWMHNKGPRVTERLLAAGARPVARAGDVALLAVR